MPAPADASSTPRALELVVLVGAVLGGVVLRLVTHSDLWLDEALSANIAALPLADLPDALRQDGHPPLYYVLLHAWMSVVGEGDAAVRALSGLLSVATLPVLGVMALRRRGLLAALWTVVLAALLPYATRYGTEARMYALVMLLVAVGWWLLDDVVRHGRWASLLGTWLVAVLLLYTHYWSVWILGTTGILLLLLWWRGATPEVRRGAARGAGALVAAGVAFLPWVPIMLDQLERTGTPWGDPQRPTMSVSIALLDFAGGGVITEAIVGAVLLALLLVLGLTGVPRPPWSIELDLRTVPGVRLDVAVAVGALVVGTTVTWLSGATFASRYAAISMPVLLVAAGVGVTAAPRRLAVALGGVVALVFAVVAVAGALEERTQGGDAAAAILSGAAPGDVVLVCPDQLGPALSRGLASGPDLEVLTYPTLAGPERVDWRDYGERNEAADPAAIAAEVGERAEGGTIWLVWMGGYATYDTQCEEVRDLLASEGLLETVVAARPAEVFEPMWVERIAPAP
ncbi:glycosyltransferase family 39 protein [Actinomarinicola tropica]|uniref:Uncharacterized protein n=1 Tax=Actinomarinicola tropica TaxID=2789776 RepID=A0A5Q2RN72_9ACTN|nr:glycosyltransferase family 39 protein [Actinomarinicola tropica]QGG95350.1 hypothetical protein GH723_09715 [Actinomarinicola tropica]